MTAITDFTVKSADGSPASLEPYRGKVLLIVNTASKCGFTPQYEGLEALHRDYAERGFEVLAFPCNQFGGQEPGDAAEIANFCTLTYDADPLFERLKSDAPGVLGSKAIKWNFTKFLVDREGTVLDRYAPTTKPEDIRKDIEKLL
jgi:glutathione peroxidase